MFITLATKKFKFKQIDPPAEAHSGWCVVAALWTIFSTEEDEDDVKNELYHKIIKELKGYQKHNPLFGTNTYAISRFLKKRNWALIKTPLNGISWNSLWDLDEIQNLDRMLLKSFGVLNKKEGHVFALVPNNGVPTIFDINEQHFTLGKDGNNKVHWVGVQKKRAKKIIDVFNELKTVKAKLDLISSYKSENLKRNFSRGKS